MIAARHRLTVDQFYVPIAELSAQGMQELQRDAQLPKFIASRLA